MKVIWRTHSQEEATWDAQEAIQAKYPQMFESLGKLYSFKIRGPNFLRGRM